MFKKLFGRNGKPTKEGTLPSIEVSRGRWIKKFTLELTNMEGSPTYGLIHQLSIGSEVGNIVISDPSVSPKHCTFILRDQIVSVIDHGSIAGTFINGKKINPGKYIILEETDVIMVGDLEVKIFTENVPESDKPLEEESHKEELIEDEALVQEDDESEVPEERSPSIFARFFKKKEKSKFEVKKNDFNQKKENKKKRISISRNPYATNSIVRLTSVIGDVLIAYSLYIIFFPFDEFRHFLSDVPILLTDLLGVDWSGLWSVLSDEYAFLGELLKDLYTFFSVTFQIGPFFLLFIIVRLITTLLFGVSISEAILGVRSHGNVVWKRIGGVIRVLIGIFTGPLLIFDVPALVSRRTFKEFMTFTHTYLSSKFFLILGCILYLPLLFVLVLLSPLLQGLELPEPIAVNERLDKRLKVIQPEEVTEKKVKEKSNFLNLELDYEPKNISLVPMFKFSGQGQKLNYKPSLVVYHKDLQRTVSLEVFKTFDFKELLGIGIKGNFFLYEKFADIYNFVYSSDAINESFKGKDTELANRHFADQVVSFTKIAFELNAGNAFEQMQTYTPLIKSLMDYRSSFLALIEYKEFDQIDFLKIGNTYFLRISYQRQKPFDLIIPLLKGDGRVIKIEFDKKENLGILSNKFYKFSLNDSNWAPTKAALKTEDVLNALQVLDVFSKFNFIDQKISSEKAQSLYGYYFEKSSEIFKKDDSIEYDLWKKSVESIFMIMEKMLAVVPKEATIFAVEPTTESTIERPAQLPVEVPAIEDSRVKLFNNFQDLKDAVENKNKDYFGIQESVSI